MNFPSPTQSLQARAQPGGITPELIRLLAQMKVKQETDAVARDMAMKMGQQPPTVADSVNAELEGNARQQIEQKLGGLQALSQQQAPQGAPTMPAPPEQPTQHMAAGGLTKLRSNLPGNYAGGGIVAFEDGGGVDEVVAGWLEKIGLMGPKIDASEKMSPQERQAQALAEVNKVDLMNPQTPHRTAFDDRIIGGEQQPEPIPGESTTEWNRRVKEYYMRQIDQGAALRLTTERNAPNIEEAQRRINNVTNPSPVAQRASVAASGKKTGVAAIPQNVVPVAAPVSGLQADYETNARKDINADPAMAGLIERTASKERRQAELGGDEAALRAARQQDYEQAKAAHEARMAKSAPSIWDRMGTLGRNAGYGQWGKAAGDQRKMELEHEARGASGLEALLKRKGEVDAMSLADKKAAFDYAEGRGTAAQTAAADSRKGALTSAGQLVATQGTNATTLAATKMQGENQYRVALLQAASHASDLAQRRIDSMDSKTAQIYARSHDIAMKQATEASNKFAESLVGGATRPGETPESVFTKVYNQAMMTVPGYVPIKNAVADSGMSTKMAEVAAELARRKGGK